MAIEVFLEHGAIVFRVVEARVDVEEFAFAQGHGMAIALGDEMIADLRQHQPLWTPEQRLACWRNNCEGHRILGHTCTRDHGVL